MSQFTVALSKTVLSDLLTAAESGFYTVLSDTKTSGAMTVSYDLGIKMQGGTFGLSNNTINFDNVQVVNNPSTLDMTIQLPNLCTPSFTIPIINVTVGSVCLFSSPPQLNIHLDLTNYLELAVSIDAGAVIKYYNNPAWAPGMSDMDAYKTVVPPSSNALNAWQIFAKPTNVNVQIHIIGSLGAAFSTAVQNAFSNLIGQLPGWAQPLAWGILGPLDLFIAVLLGITGSVVDWILGLLTGLFNLASVLETPIAQYFASKYFLSLPDPVAIPFDDPVIPGIVPAPVPAVVWNPVFISIRNPSVAISPDEMVISTDIA